MVRVSRRWLVLLAVALLPACGYRLQGTAALPQFMAVPYIEAENPYSDLVLSLERSLRAAGMDPRREPVDSTVVVRVNRDEFGQRVLSVSAGNVPQEFEIYYTVAYEVVVDGEVLLKVDSRTLTRDYTFDPTQVMAKRREEEFLRQNLADGLVRLMMRRIAALETESR